MVVAAVAVLTVISVGIYVVARELGKYIEDIGLYQYYDKEEDDDGS